MTIAKKNLTIGSASIRFQFYDPDTELWDTKFHRIGNAPDITTDVDIEWLTHEDAEVKGTPEDDKVATAKIKTFNFTLDELAHKAQAYHGYSKLVVISQDAEETNKVFLTDAEPGAIFDLGKNYTGVRKLDYDGGTAAFALDETVTGAGGGTGKITQIIGDDVSGTLYLENFNGTAFIDDEVLTGDVTGVAVANGTAAFYEFALSVEDTDVPETFLTAGVDYTTTSRNGDITFLPGGYCDGLTKINFTVKFVNEANEIDSINFFTEDTIRARIWLVTDNLRGSNFSYQSWDGSLTGEGGSSLVGKEWQTIGFVYTIYEDSVGHPENPHGQKKLLD